MKISNAIATLQAIQQEFGDIEITGGEMSGDTPPRNIIVTDNSGIECWPEQERFGGDVNDVDGVFIE